MTSTDAVQIPLPPSVTVISGQGDLPMLRVLTPLCTGHVYLQGAHVTSWTPSRHDPVLWMSRAAEFAVGTPIRGGVPICLPWFGAGVTGDKVPSHGVARVVPWELIEATDDDGTVTLVLRLTSADATGVPGAEHVPGPFEATYTVIMGETLNLSLEVRNSGEHDIEVEEALHTYLDVHDVTGVTITGLAGADYLDKLTGETVQQHGDVRLTAETDRVYRSAAAATIVDPGRSRVITIEKQASANTVVWNPWAAKAAAMPDFGDEEWPGMLCVETANAVADRLRLAPGEIHTMAATISATIN